VHLCHDHLLAYLVQVGGNDEIGVVIEGKCTDKWRYNTRPSSCVILNKVLTATQNQLAAPTILAIILALSSLLSTPSIQKLKQLYDIDFIHEISQQP